MNTWIRALLAGMLGTLAAVVAGMGIASNIIGKGILTYYGWALLAALPFLILFILMLIWLPYKDKGKGNNETTKDSR
jgi:MFS family permease